MKVVYIYQQLLTHLIIYIISKCTHTHTSGPMINALHKIFN